MRRKSRLCWGLRVGASEITTFLGALPGGGIAALAIWFAIRKDNQLSAQNEKFIALAQAQAVAAAEVKTALEQVRDAIRTGTRS